MNGKLFLFQFAIGQTAPSFASFAAAGSSSESSGYLCFRVAFFVQDWESGWAQRRTCDRNLQWPSRQTWQDTIQPLVKSIVIWSYLLRFRCARLKIATTFRVSKVFSKSVMKAFVLIHDDARLASSASDLLLQFWLLWDFDHGMPHNPLILISFFIVFPKHGVWEVPQISSRLPKPSHGRSRGGHGLFPPIPGICARQSLLGFVWRWRICEWKCLGNVGVCGIFEQDD